MSIYAKPIYSLKNKLGNWLYHLGAWLVYMTYESFSVALATGSLSRLSFYLLHYAVNILLFYFHAELVLPLATQGKKSIIWRLLLITLLEIALFLAFKFAMHHLIAISYPMVSRNEIIFDRKFVAVGVWRSVYFILLASGYYFLRYYLKERDHRELLEKRALEQELSAKEQLIELNKVKNAFLRAQINPHFFFNTLNFVYSSIHKTDPKAAKTLSLLSKLLRYALESGNGPGMILIEEEFKPAAMLLDLWRIRQGDNHAEIVFDIADEARGVKFVPLILLTLLENMLKHGNLRESQHPGMLKVRMKDQQIILTTKNLINTGLKDSGHHAGLDNIRQRLIFTFGNKAVMNKYVKENYFIVEIRFPII